MDFSITIEMSDQDRPIIGLFPPWKLVSIAQYAGLGPGQRVLDLGCGYGETLLAWAKHFGISGVGVDAEQRHIDRAREAVANTAYADRVEYICADATQYPFVASCTQLPSFHMAACITATNMFGRADVRMYPSSMFRNAIRHMKKAIRDGGYLLIAEPYYHTADVPQALIDYEGPLNTEADLIRTIREEGFELVQIAHSDRSDWDRYISSNLYHTIRWLKENPTHLDRQRKLESHRRWQDMYVGYRLKLQGCVALLMTSI